MAALRALTLLVVVGVAAASCPNKCSGHGQCSTNDKCSCYSNYQGSDCSLRTSEMSVEGVCGKELLEAARDLFHCRRGHGTGMGVGFPCNLPTACGIGTNGRSAHIHAMPGHGAGVSAPAHPALQFHEHRAFPPPPSAPLLRFPHPPTLSLLPVVPSAGEHTLPVPGTPQMFGPRGAVIQCSVPHCPGNLGHTTSSTP